MSALIKLAERVEAATGPDRGLDRDIADALGLGPGETWERPRDNGRITDIDKGSWIKGGRIRDSKRYTASLDAAMTLVPEGCAFSLHVDADGSVFAGVMRDDGDGCDYARRCGATPALALCAAALRARASETTHGQ